ncbi:Sau3AI family type II restriction endonuclease [Porphyromonas sp. COT-290 OH3588]|uniref:Sau3AI family type II restriction endonuclease n=1 Tax=Porphyromonas sp. COT-290 OH3588 TaxID=1515617 RepID=UPI00069399AA|nr:Sau3AI family type II restriction endonuclease [Porphyromonas sp. COT-290 OH3588]
MSYNSTSRKEILEHARLLLGNSLRGLYQEVLQTYKGKGGLGVCVEELHFKYTPNSKSNPDFPEAGVELKCTPLKKNKDGSLVSKERLVLNIIDYTKEADADFETSSFWKKNQLLLLLFYLHESDKDFVEFVFKIVRYWKFPEEDLKIIKDDWAVIHKKIVSGEAHTLSEGDTFYLGACVKGLRGGGNKRKQYRTEILADQRAYSLKSKYLNTIILDALSHPEMVSEAVGLSPRQKEKIKQEKAKIESIVQSVKDYIDGETFEQLIERKFSPYYGSTIYEIEKSLDRQITSSPKAISNAVVHAILGVESPKISEFEKANIQQKSIRLESNGRLREAMSFSRIQYDDLMLEEVWEESVWYSILTMRFLFVIFRKSEDGDDKAAVLEKVFFWTMPYQDLEKAKLFWLDTRNKVRKGIFDQFMSSKSNNICHVRPKARNAQDLMQTASFGSQKKNAYWLNRGYIWKIISKYLGV